MKDIFNGKLETEWISTKDRLPLDELYENHPEWKYSNIFIRVFVLVDDDDPNSDPVILELEYYREVGEEKGRWVFDGNKDYYYADQIVFWAEIPGYTKKSIKEYDGNIQSNL
jgi:hypothetical protein